MQVQQTQWRLYLTELNQIISAVPPPQKIHNEFVNIQVLLLTHKCFFCSYQNSVMFRVGCILKKVSCSPDSLESIELFKTLILQYSVYILKVTRAHLNWNKNFWFLTFCIFSDKIKYPNIHLLTPLLEDWQQRSKCFTQKDHHDFLWGKNLETDHYQCQIEFSKGPPDASQCLSIIKFKLQMPQRMLWGSYFAAAKWKQYELLLGFNPSSRPALPPHLKNTPSFCHI